MSREVFLQNIMKPLTITHVSRGIYCSYTANRGSVQSAWPLTLNHRTLVTSSFCIIWTNSLNVFQNMLKYFCWCQNQCRSINPIGFSFLQSYVRSVNELWTCWLVLFDPCLKSLCYAKLTEKQWLVMCLLISYFGCLNIILCFCSGAWINNSFKFTLSHTVRKKKTSTIFLMDNTDLQCHCNQEISNYKSLHQDPILLSNWVTMMTIGWTGATPQAPAGLMGLL